jgi:hypothetical protein
MEQQKRYFLRLRGRTLFCYRKKQEGWSRKVTKWVINQRSQLPRGLFHLVIGFCKRALVRAQDAAEFPEKREAVLRGLTRGAAACSCSVRLMVDGADIVWILKDRTPLIALQVHDGLCQVERARAMSNSHALLRGVIELRHDGTVWFVPRAAKASTNLAPKLE